MKQIVLSFFIFVLVLTIINGGCGYDPNPKTTNKSDSINTNIQKSKEEQNKKANENKVKEKQDKGDKEKPLKNPSTNLNFTSFANKYLESMRKSKSYYIEHSETILEVYIFLNNKQYVKRADANSEYEHIKGSYEVLKLTPEDTKTTIGNNMILMDRFIVKHRGMTLLFRLDSINSVWKLYAVEYTDPFF